MYLLHLLRDLESEAHPQTYIIRNQMLNKFLNVATLFLLFFRTTSTAILLGMLVEVLRLGS